MKVKKFIAPTMPEAMKKVRKELGTDSVILNSKEIYQGGFLGFFKKRNIEVIAALDPQPEPDRESQAQQTTVNVPKERPSHQIERSDSTKEVYNEIKELKRLVERNASNYNHLYPDAFQPLYAYLLDQDVHKELAQDLMDAVVEKRWEKNETLSADETKKWLLAELMERLSPETFGGINYNKKYIHLVGPTGVGKTTTIAKIAANSILQDKKRVALITTDTYRIAAIEQLKTYSKILDLPMEIAYSADDYKKAQEKFKDYDVVLVDTAGRNFKDPTYVKELSDFIDNNNDLDTYLVLSLTTRAEDLEHIFNQFVNIPLQQLIFTKKDETSKYGAILNLCLRHNIGVAYVTNGQDVPDDIKEASPEKISRMVVGGYGEE